MCSSSTQSTALRQHSRGNVAVGAGHALGAEASMSVVRYIRSLFYRPSGLVYGTHVQLASRPRSSIGHLFKSFIFDV